MTKIRAFCTLLPLALGLAGCGDEDFPLELMVPSGENGGLYGVVQLSARGSYPQLEIWVEDEILASGPGPNLASEWNTAFLDEGTYTLYARGTQDGAILEEVVRTVTVVEPPEPIVTMISPVNNAVYSEGPIPVEFTVSSLDDLASVTLSAGGEVIKGFEAGAAYTFDWSPEPGDYTLTAKAESVFGESGSDSVKVTLDSATCEISKPKDGGTISGTQEVTVAASFLGGEEVTEVALLLAGVEVGTDQQSPWSVIVDLSDRVDAKVLLQAVCTGSLGTVLSSREVTVTVTEPTPFSVEITKPKADETVSGTVTVKAAIGGGSGVDFGELYVDETLVTTLDKSPWEFTWDTTAFANGSATVKVLGYEQDTGATASDSVLVTIAN